MSKGSSPARRRIAVVGAVFAVALGTGVSGAASATAAGDGAALACPVGYLCLQPQSGSRTVLVRQGERASFSPALRVAEVTNSTRVTYCVTGDFSYPLGAGRTQSRESSVVSVAPMPPGGACLL
ncbi:hypothetical protein [Streptomyces sp. JV178]|jgi:hypothetical protein|uniref:hypothetical protein n=1 Tax=Streptomyces sp. JV178 TaxID=858632 RepID=UPI0015D531A9|nr:hypothetical protein [Streptomyces sp. JV178]